MFAVAAGRSLAVRAGRWDLYLISLTPYPAQVALPGRAGVAGSEFGADAFPHDDRFAFTWGQVGTGVHHAVLDEDEERIEEQN